MYPTYDMNPLAIKQMNAERLEKQVQNAQRWQSLSFRSIGTFAAVLFAVAVFH